jgi:hypothetical protein
MAPAGSISWYFQKEYLKRSMEVILLTFRSRAVAGTVLIG